MTGPYGGTAAVTCGPTSVVQQCYRFSPDCCFTPLPPPTPFKTSCAAGVSLSPCMSLSFTRAQMVDWFALPVYAVHVQLTDKTVGEFQRDLQRCAGRNIAQPVEIKWCTNKCSEITTIHPPFVFPVQLHRICGQIIYWSFQAEMEPRGWRSRRPASTGGNLRICKLVKCQFWAS